MGSVSIQHSSMPRWQISCTPGLTRSTIDSPMLARSLLKSVALMLNSIVPASVLEMSRMSLMICSSISLLLSIMLMNFFFCSGSSVSASILENPTMELRGVLISWLMLARKADLSLSASLALSRASTSLIICSLRSVMRVNDPMIIKGLLSSSYLSTLEFTSIHSIRSPFPSLILRRNSI